MWRGDLASAEANFSCALEQLDHNGNTEWRVMTDNYMAVIQRKRGDLKGVRHWAELTLVGAKKARMPLYLELSRANLAWLALREGRLEEAERLATETLAALQPLAFQVKWLAAWPLVACRHARDAMDQAGDAIRVMLHPQQQRQPAELTEALQDALTALESRDPSAAQARLSSVLPMARTLGYI